MVWILCTIVVFTNFSQTTEDTLEVTLEPDSVLTDTLGNVTHFAWRINDQVPLIAEHVIRSNASVGIEAQQDSALTTCDSLLDISELKVRVLQSSNQVKDRQIDLKIDQIDAKNKIIGIKETSIAKLRIKVIAYPIVGGVVGLGGGYLVSKLVSKQ